MFKVFLLTDSTDLSAAIGQHLRRAHRVVAAPLAVEGENPQDGRWVLENFRRLAAVLGPADTGLREPRGVIVLCRFATDGQDVSAWLDPLEEHGGWGSLVGMLILAFPEIHWVFLTDSAAPTDKCVLEMVRLLFPPLSPGESNEDTLAFNKEMARRKETARCRFKEMARCHFLPLSPELGQPRLTESLADLLRLHGDRFTPLFDPGGLRQLVRCHIRHPKDGSKGFMRVPVRPRVAATIDDEEAYAFFNMYTAYRFGYRGYAVISYGIMNWLFRKEPGPSVDLVFEDLALRFPDRPSKHRLMSLKYRDANLPGLKKVLYRIIITAGGPALEDDPDVTQENEAYQEELRARHACPGKKFKEMHKPLSGVFNLWADSEMLNNLGDSGGKAPNFAWPPREKNGVGSPHGAPGRLLEVANHLLCRARQKLQTVAIVNEAVHGAVLAQDAHELLGNLTPTTALEAISVQHQLEATAECLFHGVAYNFDVDSRLDDVRAEVASVGDAFASKTRQGSMDNAESMIVNQLVLRFRQMAQFDEENVALNRARTLRWSRLNPIRFYVLPLMRSIWLFLIAVASWIVIFGFCFWQLMPEYPFSRWVCYSALVFTSMGIPSQSDVFDAIAPTPAIDRPAPKGDNDPTVLKAAGKSPTDNSSPPALKKSVLALGVFEILFGFIHLGIALSYGYALIQRK